MLLLVSLKNLKKIFIGLVILVFGLMIFNYTFFRAYVKLNKKNFRKELLASASSSVEKLQMSSDQLYKNYNGFEWHENNKEISILGKFYEVVKVETRSGICTIHIIKDDKENELFGSFFRNKIKDNDFFLHFLKLIFGMHLNSFFEHDFSRISDSVIQSFSFRDLFQDSNFNRDIIKPPRFL